MARKKSLEKEKHWREIFQRQASSGLSVRGFCAGEGMSEPSFYAWRKRLRERSDEATRDARRSRGDEKRRDVQRLTGGWFAAPRW